MSTLKTPFRYDFVGSFLRPQILKDSKKKLKNGEIQKDEYDKIVNEEITKLVAKQKKLGFHAITDGEFRRTFWHLDFMWGFEGVEHEDTGNGVKFDAELAKLDDTYLVGKIKAKAHPFVEYFKFLKQFEDENTVAKYTIPAPAQTFQQFIVPNNIEGTRKFYADNDELIKDIAEKNHIICYDVYTGFKWIADVIRKEGGEKFIGGGEESFGYMPGAFTRDKDGVSATSLMAEIAAWVKMQNKTLYSFLKEIYAKYGFSQERMIYIVRKGLSGAQEIKAMMEEFRHNTPKEINHSPVVLKKDYLSLEATNLQTGEKTHLNFETKSDVLQFFLADGSKISVRPSGTEPKIKFYFEGRAQMKDMNDYERAQQDANARIDAIIKDLKLQ